MTDGPRRLLLLEFLCHRDDRSETSQDYPFLKGVARDSGVPARWAYLAAVPAFRWEAPAGRTLRAGLRPGDARRLRALLDEWRPTHVVVNEVPDAATRAALERSGASLLVLPAEFDLEALVWDEARADPEMGPHLRLVRGEREDRLCRHKPAWFADWLGAAPHPREGAHLLDATRPDYEAELLGADGPGAGSFPLILLGGQSCRGRPSVAGNPVFRGLGPASRFNPGCSFCGGADEGHGMLSRHRAGSLELAERQLRLAAAAPPGRGRARGTFIVNDLGLFLRFDAFFRMVLDGGFAPARFVFCPRIDDVLRSRGKVEALLPAVAAAGHRIGFDVMGLENFDPEAMLLYNKDITVAQADELVALQERWHARWPAVFDPPRGGRNWLMLLYTPWTTLEQLRLNYAEAARRGFDSDQYWLCTSLLLRKGSPLEALAEREEDILVPEYEDRGLSFFPVCGMQAMWGARPWRFKDPRVGDVFAVVVRLFAALERPEARPLFGADPALDEYLRLFLGGRPSGRRPPWTLLDVARGLVDAADSSPRRRSRAELLREAVSRARVAAKARPAPSAPSPGETVRSVPLAGPERAAVDAASASLSRGRARGLEGVEIAGADAPPRDPSAVRLDLRVDGRRLVLLLERGEGPAFLRSGSFRVTYVKEGPAWPSSRLGAASERLLRLVRLIESRWPG